MKLSPLRILQTKAKICAASLGANTSWRKRRNRVGKLDCKTFE